MSKKSKRRRPKTKKRPVPTRFATGIKVRVKTGTTVPDFPDIPLGGWSGTVIELNDGSNPPTYLIKWDRCTLEQMHPVYRKRCERDGLGLESMWLGEEDIESDTGEPAAIEQPTRLLTRPLKLSNQDDRIRAIFGLTSDDPLPASLPWPSDSSWRTACPIKPPAGTCGAITGFLSPTPPSKTGWRPGGKKAARQMDAPYLDWELSVMMLKTR